MKSDGQSNKQLTNLTLEIVKMNYKIDQLDEKFDTNERFDRALDKLDLIIGELKAVREEQAAHYLQHEDIDKRFTKIESTPLLLLHNTEQFTARSNTV